MKKYIQPSIEILEVESEQLIAASVGLDKGNKYGGDGTNFVPGFRNPFAMPGFDNPFED